MLSISIVYLIKPELECETAEAFRYFGEGNTQGKVVITMEENI